MHIDTMAHMHIDTKRIRCEEHENGGRTNERELEEERMKEGGGRRKKQEKLKRTKRMRREHRGGGNIQSIPNDADGNKTAI